MQARYSFSATADLPNSTHFYLQRGGSALCAGSTYSSRSMLWPEVFASMYDWPNQPWIVEINTWTWLCGLTLRYGRKMRLDCVPGFVWDELAATHADGVWLMGVWRRSAAGQQISFGDPNVLAEGRRLFSDFSPQDVSGSPYSIADYCVDSELGGADGLAEARRQLAARGLRMMLDFVPNHVAPDHPWTSKHPEYFVQGERDEHQQNPKGFFSRWQERNRSWPRPLLSSMARHGTA
jgi:hypothetical protein